MPVAASIFGLAILDEIDILRAPLGNPQIRRASVLETAMKTVCQVGAHRRMNLFSVLSINPRETLHFLENQPRWLRVVPALLSCPELLVCHEHLRRP